MSYHDTISFSQLPLEEFRKYISQTDSSRLEKVNSSTVPADIEVSDCGGDFARLIPSNDLAKQAFSKVIEIQRLEPEQHSHHRKYIFYTACKTDTASHPSKHLEESSADETEESDLEATSPIEPLRWEGYYRLNMEIPPRSRRLGWLIGKGRHSQGSNVDIWLCPNRSPQHAVGVGGRHFRLQHNLQSGALLVCTTNRPVILDGKEELVRGKRAISTIVTSITIGGLAYILHFTNISEALYKKQLASLRDEVFSDDISSPWLELTPRATHFEIEGYTIHGNFARGATCTVAAGVAHVGGDPVAIKRMIRSKSNFSSIRSEVRYLKKLDHPRIVSLRQVIYRGGSEDSAGPNQLDEVFLIYSPLAHQRLYDLIASDLSLGDRVMFIKQCCEGLNFLHAQGIMHRDIKPPNIGIYSIHPPSAFLLDFGDATDEQESSDHMRGTIPYLAPEVLMMKRGIEIAPYKKSVDIWSLGLSSLQLMTCDTALPTVDDNCPTNIKKAFEREWDPSITKVVHLLRQMLQWKPIDRITAEGALRHPALCDLDSGLLLEHKTGGKRRAVFQP